MSSSKPSPSVAVVESHASCLCLGRGRTKKQRWGTKVSPQTSFHLSPVTSVGPKAGEGDERDRADLGWDRPGNRFQGQIDRMGQRRAGVLAASLAPLASKHALVFSKVAPLGVFVLSIAGVVA